MASFLDSTITASLTGQMINHFDTFAPHNTIIVYKEPIKTISINESLSSPGYPNYNNENLSEGEVSYTPVTGIFNGIVINKKNNKYQPFSEVNSVFWDGDLAIKVNLEAKNYINDGKTEKIVVNDITYNLNSSAWTQNYLGLKYYYFALKTTN